MIKKCLPRIFLSIIFAELKKGMLDIRLDLKQFEDTYHVSSQEFYRQFQAGKRDDREDYMMWAGLYEMYCDNEHRLQELV